MINMDDIIRQIYTLIIRKSEYKNKTEKEMEKILRGLSLAGRPENMGCKDEVLLAAAMGQEEGFIIGFKYAVRMMTECFLDEKKEG